MTLLPLPALRAALVALVVAGATLLPASTSASATASDAPCRPSSAASMATPVTGGSGSWHEHAPMPRQRSELGAVAIDGTIYVVGGFGGEAMLDCYHVASDTWATGADLPEGVHHPGVAALGGEVYVAGGYTDDGATASVWAYDPTRDTWEARASLPDPRGALGLVALDGRLYAVGGARETLNGPVTGAVDVYDPSSDSWQSVSEMPTPREHLAVVAGDDRIFAIGGRADMDEAERFSAAAEAYDPSTDTWESLPALPTPRGGFSGTFAGGMVIVLGGERGTTTFSAVDAYDPVSATWRALPDMPTARHGVGVAAVDGTVYAIGGSTVARTVDNTGANESMPTG